VSTLVVPIELAALPVGSDEPGAVDLAHRFDIGDELLPWLGIATEPQPFTRSATLVAGVHLHWLLPAALTTGRTVVALTAAMLDAPAAVRGVPDDVAAALRPAVGTSADTRDRLAGLLATALTDRGHDRRDADRYAHRLAGTGQARAVFPTVPNRWRVSRWIGPRTGLPSQSWVMSQSWMVESDRLWDGVDPSDPCLDQNRLSPTVPDLPPDLAAVVEDTRIHRHLGRVFPASGWQETTAPRHRPLTAVGYGHPGFSGVLAHCYNVFGLCDPLAGQAPPTGGLTVSYTVLGWWSDPADDPAGRAGELGWALAPGTAPPGDPPGRTVLRGELLDVAWDPVRTPHPAPRPMTVAIGSSAAEALAAVLARQGELLADPHAERYLTALQFGLLARLDDARPGALKEWDEELHRRDFVAVPGGTGFELRARDTTGGPGGVAEPLVAPLAELNAAQTTLDGCASELAARRAQLFADWSNLLLGHAGSRGAYPVAVVRALRTARTEVDAAAARAAAAAAARDRSRAALEERAPDHVVGVVATPRYWRPADPVVLLWGEDARSAAPLAATAYVVTGDIDAPPGDAAPRWNPPWRPLLLSWEATFWPAAPEVDERLLIDRFPFDSDDPNELVDPPPEAGGPPTPITGTVVLNPAPLAELAAQARDHLVAAPDPGDDPDRRRVHDDLGALAALVNRLQPGDGPASPIQSQSLNGLGAALLGRRESIELPVLDPHAATDDDAALGTDLRAAIGRGATAAVRADPATGAGPAFHPLRAGHLQLTRLWLVDSFGRRIPLLRHASDDARDVDPTHLVDPGRVVRSERLAPPSDTTGRCSLRPRLVQPAQLTFGWEGPVLGWLLTHHLDNALAVYGPDGAALGALDVDTPEVWQGAPGSGFDLPLHEAIPPGHLRDLVEGIVAADDAARSYLQALIDTIDELVERVLPPDPARHAGLALLVGRPLAIVRATLNLEVLGGRSALDQRRDAFTGWVRGAPRGEGGIGGLRVPVRLGLRRHLDDGLIGYFLGADHATFLAEGADRGRVRDPAAGELTVRAGDPDPVVVSMLVDPRSPVHASTGLLPTKAISLPPDRYAPALARMAVTLPVGPVLSPRLPGPDLAVAVPTPDEPGLDWRFLLRDGPTRWRDSPVGPPLDPATATTTTHDVVDGWLRPEPAREEHTHGR
jgi:hypothetical protein